MINILFNDKEFEVEKGRKISEIFKNEIEEADKTILGCRVNNEIKSLDYELNTNAKIEFITYKSKDGRRIYRRGLVYVMAMAFNEVCKQALLTVEYQLSNALLCAVDNMEITESMIQDVKKKMNEIIQKDLPIRKVMMTKEDAEVFYKKERTLKGKLQLDAKEKDEVMLYYCENYYDYFYGVMPQSTGYLKVFDIEKYDNGFLIRYPAKERPDRLSKFDDHKKLFETLEDYNQLHKILDIRTIYKLNNIILNNKEKETILVDEALHEKRIAEIANDIVNKTGVKVILIAGPSSSGKTTFAQRLGIQLRLNGIKPVTISVDNYFVEREETPLDEFGKFDFESIDAIDLKLFNNDLQSLIDGKTIEAPTFDFLTGHKVYNGNIMKLENDEVLVIEGIHCLNDKLTQNIDKSLKYKIYISALTVLNVDYHIRISTTDTRLIRRIVRDYNFRGYTAKHTLAMWDSVNRGEEKNIFPYQEQADIMFNSSLVYELAALRNYAIPLLTNITPNDEEFSEAKRLYRLLTYFEPIDSKYIPNHSLIREFIGGSIFQE